MSFSLPSLHVHVCLSVCLCMNIHVPVCACVRVLVCAAYLLAPCADPVFWPSGLDHRDKNSAWVHLAVHPSIENCKVIN